MARPRRLVATSLLSRRAEEPVTNTCTPPASIRRRTRPSQPGTYWTSSRYRVTSSRAYDCGQRRACSSSIQPRSDTVMPVSRSSSSRSSNCDSAGAPECKSLERRSARYEVLPLRRTPMTANAFPGIAGSLTSRRVSRRGGRASDSSSLERRRFRDIVISIMTISSNMSLCKGQSATPRYRLIGHGVRQNHAAGATDAAVTNPFSRSTEWVTVRSRRRAQRRPRHAEQPAVPVTMEDLDRVIRAPRLMLSDSEDFHGMQFVRGTRGCA